MGRCPAKILLIEPDSERINIRGSAHTWTLNREEDKAVKVRAITRQMQIKDTVFNLQDSKILLRAPSVWGKREGEKGIGGQ